MEDASSIFTSLFVLELANNHWGSVARGKQIVRQHGAVARYNSVKVAIKLQFRDVDSFIHKEFRGDTQQRYIHKTEATKLSVEGFGEIVAEIRNVGCIPMATPFDEASVDLCQRFEMPIIKIASSDVNDWPLIERVVATRKPVIVSTGGASEKDLDDIVQFFERRQVPLAINHCVSLYPTPDSELALAQIDYLRARYKGHVIGFSTHEYTDWQASMYMSYAKGARLWERHIDIADGEREVSPYCSLPPQIDTWFKAFRRAQEMNGGASGERRIVSEAETEYLDKLVRGVYARRTLEPGYVIEHDSFDRDFYLAIPLQKGQLSCREVMNGVELCATIEADQPLTVDHIDGPYAENPALRDLILSRGL